MARAVRRSHDGGGLSAFAAMAGWSSTGEDLGANDSGKETNDLGCLMSAPRSLGSELVLDSIYSAALAFALGSPSAGGTPVGGGAPVNGGQSESFRRMNRSTRQGATSSI